MRTRVLVRFAACIGAAVFMISGCAEQRAVTKEVTPLSTTTTTLQKQNPAQPASSVQPAVTAPPAGPAKNTASTADKQSVPPGNVTLQAALEKVYFDYDSSGLTDTARTTLVRNAELLKKYPSSQVRIEGNCDERGSAEYNLALGERRAKAAQQYLTTLGIPSGRLSVISYGKEKPAVTGADETAWSKNRRDEFKVVVP